MKNATVTQADLLLKAFDIELRVLLNKELKAFRTKQVQGGKLAA